VLQDRSETRWLLPSPRQARSSYSYDVFGAIRSQTGSSPNDWLYTGEQRDARQTVAKTSYCQLRRPQAQDERAT
jgi:hypothetical protein